MNDGQAELAALTFPELVIGIAGPIGVDLDQIAASLDTALRDVTYTSELLKLTAEMGRFPITRADLVTEVDRWQGDDTFNTYMRKMSQANALRKQYADPAVLARIAVDTIQLWRERETKSPKQLRSVACVYRPPIETTRRGCAPSEGVRSSVCPRFGLCAGGPPQGPALRKAEAGALD